MGPSGVTVEPAPGACSSDLHSRLFLYLVHPFPPGPWKSALGTSNPGSWYKQRRNDLCRGQGFSEAGGGGRTEGADRCRCLMHCCALRDAWEMNRPRLPLGEPVSPQDPLDRGFWEARQLCVLGMLYL